MGTSIRIELNEKLYHRNLERTELGRKIVADSIRLIDELGFEQFTFKKLALAIHSTEASIYRYFESKHKLLIYLVSWYWVWIDYQFGFQTTHVKDPTDKLRIAIRMMAQTQGAEESLTPIHAGALYRIVVMEASKAYLTKAVDHDNQDGLFRDYKSLCGKIVKIIQEINPHYAYPHALVSTLFESARKQRFFAQHLPSLTEATAQPNHPETVAEFLTHLAFAAIHFQPNPNPEKGSHSGVKQ